MGFVIVLLSVFMVLDCLLLILLVLMQLPKKEAGAGLAFGGAATDALFGAGSGNFLTKATKYIAIVFFSLAILLSLLENNRSHSSGSQFRRELQQSSQPTTAAPVPPPAPTPSAAPATSNLTVPIFTPLTSNSAVAPAPAAPSAPAAATNSAPPK